MPKFEPSKWPHYIINRNKQPLINEATGETKKFESHFDSQRYAERSHFNRFAILEIR